MILRIEGVLEGVLESTLSTKIQVISTKTGTALGVNMLGFTLIFNAMAITKALYIMSLFIHQYDNPRALSTTQWHAMYPFCINDRLQMRVIVLRAEMASYIWQCYGTVVSKTSQTLDFTGSVE